jgi:nucleoside-diphosphate-sugar epimerase
MRVLIVGCGYIGVPLGEELARQGHEVWGMRRTDNGRAELERAGIRPVIADITDLTGLLRLSTAYDWVVNCVSAGGGLEQYKRVYLEGTRHLLRWLEKAALKKFVYTSSTSVYGQTDGSIVDENSLTEPEAETAKVLVATERVLLEASRHGFPAVILRLAGIYGPSRGYWFKRFLEGDAVVEGKGERLMNMIHRDDAAGAISAALLRGGDGAIYNVVDNEPTTQLALFEFLARKFEQPFPPSLPVDPAAAFKRGATHKQVSNRRLREQLRYELKYPTFREGLESSVGVQEQGNTRKRIFS